MNAMPVTNAQQPDQPEWVRNGWRAFVWRHRKLAGLTRRMLAARARIDPSYVTLIERDGYVPKREKVESIGQALGDCDGALLSAGMLPAPFVDSGNVAIAVWWSVRQRLAPSAIETINLLANYPVRRQVAMIDQLRWTLQQMGVKGE